MNRSQLKALVKECLVELLSEGLGPVVRRPALPVAVSGVAEARSRKPAFNAALDTPVRPDRTASSALHRAVRAESGGNPVLADILADTAVTTLPQMIEGDRHGGAPAVHADAAARLVSRATPEELFGEDSASRWADLAFMPPKKSA